MNYSESEQYLRQHLLMRDGVIYQPNEPTTRSASSSSSAISSQSTNQSNAFNAVVEPQSSDEDRMRQENSSSSNEDSDQQQEVQETHHLQQYPQHERVALPPPPPPPPASQDQSQMQSPQQSVIGSVLQNRVNRVRLLRQSLGPFFGQGQFEGNSGNHQGSVFWRFPSQSPSPSRGIEILPPTVDSECPSSSSTILFGVENLAVTSENAELVKCGICMHIYQSPIACGNCLNHFCGICIREWLHRKPGSCPLCKNFREMRCVPMLRLMLDKLLFVCSNKDRGCEEIIRYEQVLRHEDCCDFRLTPCPHLGCGKQMIKKLHEAHKLEECEYTQAACRWCRSMIKKKFMLQHEDTCEKRTVPCNTCYTTFYLSDIREHIDACPERLLACKWCTKHIKAKSIADHEDSCEQRIVRCSGCSHESLLHEHLSHTKMCLEITVLCHRCKEEMKRKDFNCHSIEDCLQNVQHRSSGRIKQLEAEMEMLKTHLDSLIRKENERLTAATHCFSQDYKDQDIFVPFRAKNLALVRESKKKRRDRFVICENPSGGGRLDSESSKVIFKVVASCSEWFAVGICDESNVYAARKYHDTGHLSYLISANGTLYSTHSRMDNLQTKPFTIEQGNVISVDFLRESGSDQHQMMLKFVNHTQGQEISVCLDPTEISRRRFYFCACLRSPGDCIQILQSLNQGVDELSLAELQSESTVVSAEETVQDGEEGRRIHNRQRDSPFSSSIDASNGQIQPRRTLNRSFPRSPLRLPEIFYQTSPADEEQPQM